VPRLFRRTLHDNVSSSAVVQLDFGIHAIDESTFARTVSSATNTIEYRLKKMDIASVYPRVGDTFYKDPSAGRIFEVKNHGIRVTNWNPDLQPQFRKTTKWVEKSSVVNTAVAYTYRQHSGFTSYYAAQVIVPEVVKRFVRTLNGSYVEFKTTHNAFDDFGRPTSTDEISNDNKQRRTLTRYHDTITPWINGFVSRSDIQGANVIVNQYDQLTGSLRHTTENGIATEYTYNTNGELEKVINAEGNFHQYLDYYRGIPRLEIDANGNEIRRKVGNEGRLLWESVKGRTDKRTIYGYDVRGRVNKITTPERRVTDITTTPNRTESVTSGLRTIIRRDGLGREIVQSVVGGDQWFVSVPLGHKENDLFVTFEGTTYEYDGLGRITKIDHYPVNNKQGDKSFFYNRTGFDVLEIDGTIVTASQLRSYGSPFNPFIVQKSDDAGQSNIQRDSVEQAKQPIPTHLTAY